MGPTRATLRAPSQIGLGHSVGGKTWDHPTDTFFGPYSPRWYSRRWNRPCGLPKRELDVQMRQRRQVLADRELEVRDCVAGRDSRTQSLDNHCMLHKDSEPLGRPAYLTSFSISALIALPQMS